MRNIIELRNRRVEDILWKNIFFFQLNAWNSIHLGRQGVVLHRT